jgi:hypothetical protein
MGLLEFITNKGFYYDKVKGKSVEWDISPKQKEILESLDNNRLNIIKKSRQVGLSTIFIWYTVWQIIEWLDEKDKKIIFYTNKLDSSKKLLNEVKNILTTLVSISDWWCYC